MTHKTIVGVVSVLFTLVVLCPAAMAKSPCGVAGGGEEFSIEVGGPADEGAVAGDRNAGRFEAAAVDEKAGEMTLYNGTLVSSALLEAWADALAGRTAAPSVTVPELDEDGRLLSRATVRGVPRELEVDGVIVKASEGVLLELADQVESDGEGGILIWIIYIGNDDEE